MSFCVWTSVRTSNSSSNVPNSARKGHERLRAKHEMKFPHGEVMEAEGQARRDVRVGKLLVRQGYIEADRLGSGIERAAVRRLHDAGAASGHDDGELLLAVGVGFADEPSEFAGDVVIAALGEDSLCGGKPMLQLLIAAIRGERICQPLHLAGCRRMLADTGAPEDHDGLAHPCFLEKEVSLEIVDLEAKARASPPGRGSQSRYRPGDSSDC